MVKVCCVYQCRTTGRNQHRADKQISLHSFPRRERSPARYKKWLVQINRKDSVPTSNMVVCSEHFVEEDYTLTSRLQSQLMPGKLQAALKPTTVPSLRLRGPTDEPPKPKRSKYLEIKARAELLQEIPWPVEFAGLRPCRSPSPPAFVSSERWTLQPIFPDRSAPQAPPSSPSPVATRECHAQCDVGTETLVRARQAKAAPIAETGPAGDVATLRKMLPSRRLSLPRFGLST